MTKLRLADTTPAPYSPSGSRTPPLDEDEPSHRGHIPSLEPKIGRTTNRPLAVEVGVEPLDEDEPGQFNLGSNPGVEPPHPDEDEPDPTPYRSMSG